MPYSPERNAPHQDPAHRKFLSDATRLPITRNPLPLAQRMTLDLHLHTPERTDLRILHAHLTPSDASPTTRDAIHEHNVAFLRQAVQHTDANILILTSHELLSDQQPRFLDLQHERVLYYQQYRLPRTNDYMKAA